MTPEPTTTSGMRPLDLLLYLTGNRGAIQRVAATRWAWLIGALLVLSAGIARNYDHLDLLRQKEWFIGPFAASLVSTGLIFLWLSVPLTLHRVGRYWRQLGTFLVLAWLTAPCAWLYGIPVEAMTDIMTATKWNIAFLAIVALWRVAIIVRAVSVLTDVSWIRVLPLVLAPAALEATVGSFFQGLSLVGIMGGIRLPPHTELLLEASRITNQVSLWLFLACLVASFLIRGTAKMPLNRPAAPTTRPAFFTAAACLVGWMAIAVPVQPQVANRHHLQSLFDERDLPGAVAFASEKKREDFPRHHYLPPEPGAWFPLKLFPLLNADTPSWLRQEWTANAIESLKMWPSLDDEEKQIVKNHPELREAIQRTILSLRNQTTPLTSEDRFWLKHHESMQDPVENAPAAGPHEPSDVR